MRLKHGISQILLLAVNRTRIFCTIFLKRFKGIWYYLCHVHLHFSWLENLVLFFARFYGALKWVSGIVAGLLMSLVLIDFVIKSGWSSPAWWDIFVKFFIQYLVPISITLGLYFVFLTITLIGHSQKEKKKIILNAFRLFKPAKDLTLEDLGFRKTSLQGTQNNREYGHERPFFGTYFPRKASEESSDINVELEQTQNFIEKELEQLIISNRGFLLVGPPYAGKTLTLFQVLRNLQGYFVIRPYDTQTVTNEELFTLVKGKKVVIVLDNIVTYANVNFDIESLIDLINKATKSCYSVVGTCREAKDIRMVVTGHGNHITDFCHTLSKLHLYPMTNREKMDLAQTTGKPIGLTEARLYSQPGNITMRNKIREFQDRFSSMTELERDTLRTMKLLDAGGISVTISRILFILKEAFRRNVEREILEVNLHKLWEEYFLLEQPSKEMLSPDFGYLTNVVIYQEGSNAENDYINNLTQTFEKAKDVEALLQIASFNGHRGDFAGSLQASDAVLRIEPNNADAYYHRGYTLARLRKLEDALQDIKLSIDFKPSAEGYNILGWILCLKNDLTKALDAFNNSLYLRPNFDDAHTNRASLLARLGRFQEAFVEYQNVIQKINPQSYYAYLKLGISLSDRSLFNESLKAFDKALEIRPEYPEVHLNRGIIFARKKEWEKALVEFDKALELHSHYYQAYVQRGQTLAGLKRFKDAIESISHAIKLKPDYTSAYVNRARIFVLRGEQYKDNATKDWQTALDLGYVLPQTDLVIGISLARAGNYAEAINIFNKIIDTYPKFAEAYYQRGHTFSKLNRYKEALNNFDKAIELQLYHVKAQCDRGSALANLVGRYEEALDASKLALELYPEFAPAYFNRGYVLTKAKGWSRARLEEALLNYEEAVKIRPNYPEAHRERGFILGQLEFDEQAYDAFNKAVELRPRYAEALFGKGRSLCFCVKKYPHRFPPDKFFHEVLELLKEAIEIDPNIIRLITKDRFAFQGIRSHPDFELRFNNLVWEHKKKTDNSDIKSASS